MASSRNDPPIDLVGMCILTAFVLCIVIAVAYRHHEREQRSPCTVRGGHWVELEGKRECQGAEH